MKHLNQEDIVAAYYGEPVSEEHLRACAECQAELARLATVLDRVTAPDVPEPADDYGTRVWERLRWRMRAEAKREQRSGWMKWTAVAAVTLLAFISGLLWKRQASTPVSQVARTTTAPTTTTNPTTRQPDNPTTSASSQQQRDRVLLVVVNDHFDRSERVLVELINLTPKDDNIDIGAERAVAEELLTSNRLYRRTALDRGEDSVATLLDELEPILLQIAHAPNDMSAEELRRIQKRVEAKGLVFKLRVVRNDTRTGEAANNLNQPNV
jgi:hypothetical protein